ncbi:unnamed protein product [Oppiella nova]|uniref:GDT1 family protein n=1 Tax=Oppiella nova TaxID=334625 RepID=A0A7R9MF92_9ACAR|nr:unnamed protein product [Oppiella nova]CAG2176302.1 unnamed protein product [Oppiella nova]
MDTNTDNTDANDYHKCYNICDDDYTPTIAANTTTSSANRHVSRDFKDNYLHTKRVFILLSCVQPIHCGRNDSQYAGNRLYDSAFRPGDNVNYVDSRSTSESVDEEDLWSRLSELKFFHAFIASISVIIVSELGDKTFFIAAIMAMRHARSTVFMAAMSAIFVMNTLAVLLGMATTVIPRFITHYGSIVLFALFGLKMLHEAHQMSADEGKEEYEEVQKSLSKRETADLEYNMVSTSSEDPETGVIKTITAVSLGTRLRRKLMVYVSLVFIETFTMTFLAEWGDRSQISTIILAAREA